MKTTITLTIDTDGEKCGACQYWSLYTAIMTHDHLGWCDQFRTVITDSQRCPQCIESAAHPAAIQAVVNEQAEDAGLWFQARTAPEGYLQAALRRLHRAIEGER